MSTDGITNGVAQLAVDNKPKKKRTQRAYHSIQPDGAFARPGFPAEIPGSPQPFAPSTPGMVSPAVGDPVGFGSPAGSYFGNASPSIAQTGPPQPGFSQPPFGGVGHSNPHTPNMVGSPFPQTPTQYPGTPMAQGSPFVAPGNPAIPGGSGIPGDVLGSRDSVDLLLLEFRHHDLANFSRASFLTFSNVAPPDPTTPFHAVDQGTASSKFIRSSMYYVPETEQLRAATKLPVAVTIRPFAPLLPNEEPVPVVDMRREEAVLNDPLDSGPIRCRRCRAYVNPQMQFNSNGRFSCNICQFPNNQVPNDYYAMLDHQNQRVDKFNRPELHKGVYDLIVPKEYNFLEKPSKPLHHVFLVDISELSIRQKLPGLVADAIRAIQFQVEQRFQFLIIAFDKKVHFFDLSGDTIQVVTSLDLDDPFVPFHNGLFADSDAASIEDALNYLEQLSDSTTIADPEPAFGAALRTAMMCLTEVANGGKITALLLALPSWGPGGLKFKDNNTVGRSFLPLLEHRILLSDNEFYKKLATDCVNMGVGVDVHVVAPTLVDMSNVGFLAASTGGRITRWPRFNIDSDGRRFTSHWVQSVRGAKGYQSQLKLRCLNGLQVAQYYGTSTSVLCERAQAEGEDPQIPILSDDQSFTVLLEYDGKLHTKYDCHFQAALLYTDPDGVRKVRVINLVLAVAERLQDVFVFADESSVVATVLRDSLSFVGKQTLKELRELINTKLVDVFTQYRAMSELGRNSFANRQLLFPELLKHIPLYLLSFIKTTAMRETGSSTADARLVDMFAMLNMPLDRLMYRLYPAVVQLHQLEQEDCQVDETLGLMRLPKFVELKAASLEPSINICYNGSQVIVYVDKDANPLMIQDVFGVDDVLQINPLQDELPEVSTHISQQARNLVNHFQDVNGTPFGGIRIIASTHDVNLNDFTELFVEDPLQGAVVVSAGPSYADYLSNLHKAIKTKLESDKSSGSVKKLVTAVEHSNETLAQRMINF